MGLRLCYLHIRRENMVIVWKLLLAPCLLLQRFQALLLSWQLQCPDAKLSNNTRIFWWLAYSRDFYVISLTAFLMMHLEQVQDCVSGSLFWLMVFVCLISSRLIPIKNFCLILCIYLKINFNFRWFKGNF